MKQSGYVAMRFRRVRENLRSISLADVLDIRVLGFSCTLAWIYVMFFSPNAYFSMRNDLSHFNDVFGFSNIGVISVLLFATFFPRWVVSLIGKRAVQVLWPSLMSLAVVTLALVDAGAFAWPQGALASTVIGMGLGVFFLAWGEVYKYLSSLRTVLNAAMSFLLAALLFALIVTVPVPVGTALLAVLPFGIALILFRGLKVGKEPASLPSAFIKRGAYSVRAVLSLGVISLTESAMRTLFFTDAPFIDEGSYPWLFLVATIVAACIVCVTTLSREDLDYGFAYKCVVFLLGFVFLLLPVLDLGTALADVLALVNYSSVILLTWVVLSKVARFYQISALLVFGVG
ncbi:MAG: hypothetical protein FWD72_05315, partial [Eggerthellaceae bacterium]|nr:hypothetical protein [Eggerthellaceae bacterium]